MYKITFFNIFTVKPFFINCTLKISLHIEYVGTHALKSHGDFYENQVHCKKQMPKNIHYFAAVKIRKDSSVD